MTENNTQAVECLSHLTAELDALGWRHIDCAPKNVPLILMLNGVVQNITYQLVSMNDIWVAVESGDWIDDWDFKPTHWQRLPRAKL